MTVHKPFIITIVGPESSGKTTLARQLAADLGCPWVPEYAREYLDGLGRTYEEDDLQIIARGQLEAILSAGSGQSSILPPGALKGRQTNELLADPSGQANVAFEWPPDSEASGRHMAAAFSFSKGNRANEPLVLSFSLEDFGDEARPVIVVDSGMMSLRLWAKIKYNTTIPLVEEALREDVTSVYILCRPVYAWDPDPLREAPSLVDRVWIYNQFLKEMFRLPAK